MEKKLYILPYVEIKLFNTAELMQVSSQSDVPNEPGLLPAPSRRTEVF